MGPAQKTVIAYLYCFAVGALLTTVWIGIFLRWNSKLFAVTYRMRPVGLYYINDRLRPAAGSNKFTESFTPECEVPQGGYRSWTQGMVSVLIPRVAIDCNKVLAGDREETQRVNKTMSSWKNAVSDEDMLKKVQNCTWLRDYFSGNLYNSDFERVFSIAFTLVVYDSPQQVLRLLRLLYRSQNAYCIHYDVKSQHKGFFLSLAKCFDNVMISSRLESVVWGYYTVMQAQMNCMTDLLNYRSRERPKEDPKKHLEWRYVINLCGKELPLVTNREMVSRLMKLKGSSSVIAEPCANRKTIVDRIEHPVELNENKTGIVIHKKERLKNQPFNLAYFHKSSSYNALSFQFASFLAFNQTAKKVYDFFKQTRNAEEHFYATMYKIPGVPGGFDKNIPKEHYFEVAGSFWTKPNTLQRLQKDVCHGKAVHQVCVTTAADMPNVVRGSKKRLFHNKYLMEYDHSVMDCMEERLVAQNMQDHRLECGTGTRS